MSSSDRDKNRRLRKQQQKRRKGGESPADVEFRQFPSSLRNLADENRRNER